MTTTMMTTITDIESLVRGYYVDSSRFIYDDNETKKQQRGWSNEEDDNSSSRFSYRYCGICRLDTANWLKYYCYGNKGLNRQLITICMKCMDNYSHKKHEQQLQQVQRFVAENNACLNNRNGKCEVIIGGVIDIETANNAKDKIMLACKLLAINSKSKKKNSVIGTTIASNFDSDEGSDDDCLFYNAVRMAYDQSEDVRRYFRNNPSKISPKNAGLWPLRYQSYKQFGI
jgi:hypothetical protein